MLVHAIPAHWLWSPKGFLHKLGAIDLAGCAPVHLVGGGVGFLATVMLKPRKGRFEKDGQQEMSSPTNALLG